MKTLKFMSAQALVSDAQIAQRSLVHVAYNLYPLLFKASYLLEQPTVLHDLVETWPLAEFSIKKLLGKTTDCEYDLSDRTCEACLRACFTGLKDYVLNSSGTYAKKLKTVDLTGFHDVESQQCPCKKALGRWGRTVLLLNACLDLLVEMESRELDIQTFDISIDVYVSTFVTERIYEAMAQALHMRSWCPLKIRILEFRADSLALPKLFYMIKLIQPETLLKLELVHNIRLKMKHFEMLLNHVPLPLLRSLTLPARTFDVHDLTQEDEDLLVIIGEKLSTLKHLTELNLPFSILTGRIRRLLSPLKTPLRALDLSYCSMNHADMAYLANSLHAEYLEELDLSGQSVAELFPSTFFKLLGRVSRTLRKLTLEECQISDNQVHMIILALESCRQLHEFNFLGNPLSSHALQRLFQVFTELPALRKVEFPVPKDCYPETFTYPLTEENLKNYNGEKFEEIRQDLLVILLHANRDDITLSTPLLGVFDSELRETSNEVSGVLLQSFVDVISNFFATLD